jgi:hypothetical protein
MTAGTERLVEARFDLAGRGTLEVHTVSGRVRVRQGEDGEIVMRAVLHGRDEEIDSTRIEYQQEGDHVSIRTESEHRGSGFLGRRHSGSIAAVYYDLTAPRGCVLEVHTVSAEIDVEGTGADATPDTVSGGVALVDAAGVISLRTVSGSISASGLEGELKAHSTSGHVTVRDSVLRRFSLDTVSGGMTIGTPLTAGEEYSVSTVSGSLTLTVPPDTSVDARLDSVSGSVSSDLPGDVRNGPGRRSWSGTVGDDGAHLTMHSVSGSLKLHASA